MPEKVAKLDAKIEGFLKATQAVQPIINPAFDPANYNPERIGKPARLPGPAKPGRKRLKKPAPAKPAP
jgi:hypothetical protein